MIRNLTPVVVGNTKFRLSDYLLIPQPDFELKTALVVRSAEDLLFKMEYFGKSVKFGAYTFRFPSIETLMQPYTRTSIYRLEDGAKVGEAKCVSFDIRLDIRNCHYPKYYFGSERPTDTQALQKMYFLTFAAGSNFEIIYITEPFDPNTHVLGGMSSAGYGEINNTN